MGRLNGKVAVITGAAGGQGRAAAKLMVDEGAKVVLGDVNGEGVAELASQLGDSAVGLEFDAEDVTSIKRLIDAAPEHFGRLDILHNNAALVEPAVMHNDKTAVDTSFELWDRVNAVNARGYFAGIKYAVPHMLETGGGSIVNISSVSAITGMSNQIAYSASKAAVLGLTLAVATHHGPQGIRCNAICPGLILTPTAKLPENKPMVDLIARHELTPQGGEADDVAHLVVYLASDESRFVTGQTFVIDGGRLAHAPNWADNEDRARAAAAAAAR